MQADRDISQVPGPACGLFAEVHRRVEQKGRPCLFLDRDGVVVQEVNYLHRVADIAIIRGMTNMVAYANRARVPVVMVTNQAGIGRGYFGWDAFHAVQADIHRRFAEEGAYFNMTLACAYHPDGLGDYARPDHAWRKPKPGMLLEAARTLCIDLSRSVVVGDTISDLQAGKAAGLREGWLVRTGHGDREIREKWEAAAARWAAEGAFRASLAEDGATAVAEWLGAITKDTS
ncbi:HAD family hydrolase [Rhodopseudomonas palustris]|nr:HAD family hydrolase [Rhodopseudomonas palustris]